MANDRLRSTIRTSGHTESSLAEEIGVDPKTVQRWISKGRTPHRGTATRTAKVLSVPTNWLWPDLETTGDFSSAEVVNFYPHRSQVSDTLWLDLVRNARDRIDFLTYASLFLPEGNPEAVNAIRQKAIDGVRVRIALGDPDSPEVALRGREERMPDGIPGRIRMALAYYRPLLGVPGVEFNLHRTTLYNSIYRFDGDMMINQHIYGTYGYLAPILHLRETEDGDLFKTYDRSFELAWGESFPCE